jgi:hypothetical protein
MPLPSEATKLSKGGTGDRRRYTHQQTGEALLRNLICQVGMQEEEMETYPSCSEAKM